MKDLINKIFSIYSLASFLIGGAIGGLTMYYNFQEEIHILQEQIKTADKAIERLSDEDRNIHDVLHLHYRKMLEIK